MWLLHPVTLAHYLLTKPEQEYPRSWHGSQTRGSEIRPDPRVIRFPAPVPMRTSLSPSEFYCLLFSIYHPFVPSLIVTPVSCTLDLLCSVLVPFIVLSDLMHVLCLSQTIKDPVSCMFLQFEYRFHLCLVLSLLNNIELRLTLS